MTQSLNVKKCILTTIVLFILILLIQGFYSSGLFFHVSAAEADTLVIEGQEKIIQNGGEVKLFCSYNGLDVSDNVVWYISSGAGSAVIGSDGVIKALENGTVTVEARYFDENSECHNASKNIEIINQTHAVKQSYINVGVESTGQIIRDYGLETQKDYHTTGITANFDVGTQLRLTALKTKVDFLFWKDAKTSKILTFDNDYNFNVGTDASVHAVFRLSGQSRHLVVFLNADNRIIQSEYTSGSDVTVPRKPTMPGYVFRGWSLDGEIQPELSYGTVIKGSQITSDRFYVATYVPASKLYNIDVSGGSGSGSYSYDDKVSVVLNDDEIPEGKNFVCWVKNGKVVSYNKLYSFRVESDAEIYALFDEVSIEEKSPLITLSEPQISSADKNIVFTAERMLPVDCELIETGIMVNTSDAFDLASSTKSAAKSTDNSGQFAIRKKNVSSGVTWYAKAYIIYKKNDVVYTIYSDSVSASI